MNEYHEENLTLLTNRDNVLSVDYQDDQVKVYLLGNPGQIISQCIDCTIFKYNYEQDKLHNLIIESKTEKEIMNYELFQAFKYIYESKNDIFKQDINIAIQFIKHSELEFKRSYFMTSTFEPNNFSLRDNLFHFFVLVYQNQCNIYKRISDLRTFLLYLAKLLFNNDSDFPHNIDLCIAYDIIEKFQDTDFHNIIFFILYYLNNEIMLYFIPKQNETKSEFGIVPVIKEFAKMNFNRGVVPLLAIKIINNDYDNELNNIAYTISEEEKRILDLLLIMKNKFQSIDKTNNTCNVNDENVSYFIFEYAVKNKEFKQNIIHLYNFLHIVSNCIAISKKLKNQLRACVLKNEDLGKFYETISATFTYLTMVEDFIKSIFDNMIGIKANQMKSIIDTFCGNKKIYDYLDKSNDSNFKEILYRKLLICRISNPIDFWDLFIERNKETQDKEEMIKIRSLLSYIEILNSKKVVECSIQKRNKLIHIEIQNSKK